VFCSIRLLFSYHIIPGSAVKAYSLPILWYARSETERIHVFGFAPFAKKKVGSSLRDRHNYSANGKLEGPDSWD
jgi:hypothetical protein